MNNGINSFWEWFTNNQSKYAKIDEQKNKNLLLNTFEEQLHKYCTGLGFMISNSQGNELIITANGDEKYFNYVESLIAKAPKLPTWNIIAFKPPMNSDFSINYEGLVIDTKDIWFIQLESQTENKIDLRIGFKKYNPKYSEIYLNAIFPIIDTIIGERAYAYYIEYVEVEGLPDKYEEEGYIPITELMDYLLSLMED